MGNPLRRYKAFIDGLVARSESAAARRLSTGWRYPVSEEREVWQDRRDGRTYVRNVQTGASYLPEVYERFEHYNRMADSLSEEQREWVAQLLADEFFGGIATVLRYMTDRNTQLMIEGDLIPFEPFDVEYDWDLLARADGIVWPDERDIPQSDDKDS